MSDSKVTNVDLPAVMGVVDQLGTLSTSLGSLKDRLIDGSDLTWTGADKSGTTLYEQLSPSELSAIGAVTDAKQAVDGVIDSLGTTAGLWKGTEHTNLGLNQ